MDLNHAPTRYQHVALPTELMFVGMILKSITGYTSAFLTQATFVLNGIGALSETWTPDSHIKSVILYRLS